MVLRSRRQRTGMTETQSIGTRRAVRHPIVVEVEVTDQLSGIKIKDHTKDLSLFGCGVATATPFLKGTMVMYVP
jgi:hypothetical protein